MTLEPIVAVCYRSPVLALAALCRGELLELRQQRLTSDARPGVDAARRFAAEIGAATIVVEAGSSVACALPAAHAVDLTAAKAALVGDGRVGHAALAQAVLRRSPRLARFVSRERGRGRGLAALLATALGFAAAPATVI